MGWLSNIFGKQDNETDKLKNDEKKWENILRQLETKGYVSCDDFVMGNELSEQIARETEQRKEKERLEKERKINVALRVEPTNSPETFKISGRGQTRALRVEQRPGVYSRDSNKKGGFTCKVFQGGKTQCEEPTNLHPSPKWESTNPLFGREPRRFALHAKVCL